MHIEYVKKLHGLATLPWIKYLEINGNHLVSLFYVLSGFLITYLLLAEKRDNEDIDLKSYYTRRLLRIWPLYYLIGIIGFFVMHLLKDPSSYIESSQLWRSLLYFLFLPPLTSSLSLIVTWSVRVEEAFYIAWPLFLKRNINLVRLFIAIIIITIVVRNLSFVLMHFDHSFFFHKLNHQLRDYRFSCMAIGGWAAYMYINGEQNVLSFLYKRNVQYIVYLFTAILLIFKIQIPFINYEFYSVLFAFAVLNLATNNESVIRLDYKWTNYLGKISYGLYLYHMIVCVLCIQFVLPFFVSLGIWQANLLLYATTITGTVIIAILSFEFFEKYFLGLKRAGR
jgi:peptidoglycan/LPS O-acetylase OafA/YrhL